MVNYMMDFPNIPPDEPIGFDAETTGLQYWLPDFRVTSFAIAHGGQSWAFKVDQQSVAWLTRTLQRASVVVAHNAAYDLQCARCLGIDPRTVRFHCSMIAACLIDEHQMSYKLSSVASQFGVESQKDENLEALRVAMGVKGIPEVLAGISAAPWPLVSIYVAGDASDALRIYRAQMPEIERQGLQQVLKLEMDLLPVLADMSWVGVRVDLEAAHAAIPKLDEQELLLQREVDTIAGGSFNVNSTPQVRDFFKPEPVNKFQWKLIDGTLVGPTKNGTGPSLGQEALREIAHPMAAKILALRKTIKLRDTFLQGHIIGSADGDGYVHTQFNQTRNDDAAGTVTGRLSSTGPALQQITGRDKVAAKILRSMFLPDAGRSWMRSDCSQIDFRMAAHLINDPNIIAAYAANPKTDYHQAVSDMTGIPRNATYAGAPNTKTLNLSLAFGAGAGKIAHSMGMPYTVKEFKGKMMYVPGDEARLVFDKYHRMVPGVKAFSKHAEAVAKTTGFVKTMIGRRLRFPQGVGVHKAAGLLFQAYAADAHKYGLIMVDDLIRRGKLPARLMLSVHDEIAVSMPDDIPMALTITAAFTNFNTEESPLHFRVPIMASTGVGTNWWDAS